MQHSKIPVRRSRRRSTPRPWSLVRRTLAVGALFGASFVLVPNLAPASLAGSSFEIDTNANLVVNTAGNTDWASLAHPNGPERRATDLATGQNDDSYKGGVKEDTVCPGETTGSIPNNKSDLLTFHVYEEPGAGSHPGFLNLAWSRVTDPSGTTLMDFEFNQGDLDDPADQCAQGPNVQRSPGDLLIEYAIDQGGAKADITMRRWTGTAWGPTEDLSLPDEDCGGDPCAEGTINNTVAISAADSDGIGARSLRTFGEAQIDLRTIFDATKCTSFGTAMLKSRSSDSFTSQLKDFIRPLNIDLNNCGKVIIHKVTDPAGSSDTFGYTKSFSTDPASANTFSLSGDANGTPGDTIEFDNVLFGSGLTVTEDPPTGGWDFASLDCDASVGVTPSIDERTVTFAIDSEDDVLECTYTNMARGTVVIEKIVNDPPGGQAFSYTGSFGPFDLTPTAVGASGKASTTFDDLAPGSYDVAETVPADWNLVGSSCSDGSTVDDIDLSAGETVTCTFTNERERGAIRIVKTRDHYNTPGGPSAHAGVTFTVTQGNTTIATVQTDASGEACVSGLLDGDYTVTETLPAGYSNPTLVKQVAVTDEGTCASGAHSVSFHNTPKTNLTVSVDSQVDGGTGSTIVCEPPGGATTSTGPDGDGSKTYSDLAPGTYVCTVVIDKDS